MTTPAQSFQRVVEDYATYVEDTFGHSRQVCEAWHEVLRPLDAHVQTAGLAPGLFVRLVEFDPCPGERDADDHRTVARLEFVSHVVPDVVIHLSTENTDAVPRLDILTTMRRGVGLLDREWDDLEPAEAVKRFIDRHNARAAAEAP
jgi:hypothetical protein